jgi:hypothetical protein
VATATIVTAGFVNAAEAHRRLLKQPQLPYFVVPHPIISMTDQALDDAADAIFDQIAAIISRREAAHGDAPDAAATTGPGKPHES